MSLNDKQIKTIQRVCRRLARRFTFGYYEAEDIEQEAFIIALAGLPLFNPQLSSLETFLHLYVNSRLKNFKRDNYVRQDFVCRYCHNLCETCEYCKRHEWKNTTKKNIIAPIDIDNVRDENEKNMSVEFDLLENIEVDEILSIINRELDVSLREDYLKMLHGVTISKQRKLLVEETITKILGENGYMNG
jgi:DNA-directed RNA polymerase specialized sigma24 family protein